MAEQLAHGLANGLSLGCLIGLLAVGYSLIYGVARLINFAHGDLFVLGGYYTLFLVRGGERIELTSILVLWTLTTALAIFSTLRRFPFAKRLGVAIGGAAIAALLGFSVLGKGLPTPLAVTLAMLFSAVAGVAFEYTVYKPLDGAPRLNYLVAAIGLSLALQGFMQIFFGTQRRSFPSESIRVLQGAPFWTHGYFTSLDILIISTTLLITLGTALLAKRSTIGLMIRATADDPILASRLGLDTRAARAYVFAAGTALAALAAFLFVGRQGVLEPTLGYSQGILAFSAAVIGGIGNLGGSLLGGMFIGIIVSLLPLVDTDAILASLPSFLQHALPSVNLSNWGLGVVYLLMALTLAFRPAGLLANEQTREL
jgi:branched-chain amino acid transport system permease protein